MEAFFATLEDEADHAGATRRLYDLSPSQMNAGARASLCGLMETNFPSAPPTYQLLTDAMVKSIAPDKADS